MHDKIADDFSWWIVIVKLSIIFSGLEIEDRLRVRGQGLVMGPWTKNRTISRFFWIMLIGSGKMALPYIIHIYLFNVIGKKLMSWSLDARRLSRTTSHVTWVYILFHTFVHEVLVDGLWTDHGTIFNAQNTRRNTCRTCRQLWGTIPCSPCFFVLCHRHSTFQLSTHHIIVPLLNLTSFSGYANLDT